MFAISEPFLLVLAVALLGATVGKGFDAGANEAPEYTADAQLKLPEHCREWVYLTSDFYTASDLPQIAAIGQRKFNNILVNPDAYRFISEDRNVAGKPQ